MLTTIQIAAILYVLSVFGVDAQTIEKVHRDLTPATSTPAVIVPVIQTPVVENQPVYFGSVPVTVTPVPVPVPVIQPAPQPAQPAKQTRPDLVGEPTLTFSEGDPRIVTRLSFTSNVNVACDLKNGTSNPARFTQECTTQHEIDVRNMLVNCNAPWDKGYYLFTSGRQYSCSLRLITEKFIEENGDLPSTSFTFTVPN